jgi:hypothetical protein
VNEYQRAVLQRVAPLMVSAPPSPWREHTHSRSGTYDVGFGEDSDLLLVVSCDWREVIDCSSAKVVASEPHDSFEGWHDPANLTCVGIGPLEGQRVRVAGVSGGGLSTGTRDGWSLAVIYVEWSAPYVVLQRPGADVRLRLAGCTRLAAQAGDSLRAFGFSPTGKTVVVADADEVRIFNRAPS